MNKRPCNLLAGIGVFFMSVALTACPPHNGGGPSSDPTLPTSKISSGTGLNKVSPEEGAANLKNSAKAQREKWKNKTFEEFEGSVYKEPMAGGKYIVSGDIPIHNKKLLREFFDNRIKKDPPVAPAQSTGFVGKQINKLILHQVGGEDAKWSNGEKQQLTYCVSDSFGPRKNKVVADMLAATNAWEAAADINFMHIADYDPDCTPSNSNVLFDVRPVNSNGQFLARAFFPGESRGARNVLIDDSAFGLDPSDNLQLVGILKHELGHTLGFRHEHTRPDSGACFEDNDWRPLTTYDTFSTMHYPHCNGGGDRTLSLTARDRNGAACLYGPAEGFVINTSICGAAPPPPPSPPTCDCSKTVEFIQEQVSHHEVKTYGPGGSSGGPFSVTPGTPFEVVMKGNGNPGDPDLYVRFGDQAPTTSEFTCRPYTSGADEICSLDVPTNTTKAHVMVRGFQAGSFDLTVTYSPMP